MPLVFIREIQVKPAGGGYRKQLARIKQVDIHGNKIARDFWLPVENGADPYALGVYQLSERSYYIERSTQQLKLMPRLEWVRALKSVQALADAAGESEAEQGA